MRSASCNRDCQSQQTRTVISLFRWASLQGQTGTPGIASSGRPIGAFNHFTHAGMPFLGMFCPFKPCDGTWWSDLLGLLLAGASWPCRNDMRRRPVNDNQFHIHACNIYNTIQYSIHLICTKNSYISLSRTISYSIWSMQVNLFGLSQIGIYQI